MSDAHISDTPKQKKSHQTCAQARAERLRMLRQMTGLSREKVHDRYGIPRGTLQNWESARFGGLTQKGANLIMMALRAEGVYCDLQWLLHGIGQAPRLLSASGITDETANHETLKVDPSESSTIAEELLCFRNHNSQSTDMMVVDDSMAPNFNPGDYVAGNKRFLQEIQHTIGLICIVQTAGHGTLIRYVKQGTEPDHYDLIASNPFATSIHRPHLYNVALLSSAPVIWHRIPNVPTERMMR